MRSDSVPSHDGRRGLLAAVACAALLVGGIPAFASAASNLRMSPVTSYLLCEDFDCAAALEELRRCGKACLPDLLQALQQGLPADVDPRPAPVARARAAEALGELKLVAAREALERALSEKDAVLRSRAATALGQLAQASSVPALERARRAEGDAAVREAMEAALAALQARQVPPARR